MGIIASDKGGSFELPPVGIFPAICVQVIDLGTQTNEYQGEVTTSRQIRLGWELTGDDRLGSGASGTMQNNEPFLVTEFYTLSLNEQANLRKLLEGWRGRPFTEEELKGFDITNLLGKPCLLDIAQKAKQKGGMKSFVQSAKRWPTGEETKIPFNSLLQFSLEADDYNATVYDGMTQWLKDKIALSPQWKELNGFTSAKPTAKPVNESAPFDDEIPF